MYNAHSKNGTEFQSLRDHLYNTAELASKRAAKFGASEISYICSLLHDVGKYSDKFQSKLQGNSIKVNHTGACGELAIQTYGELWGKLIAYIVTGHHTGLKDCGAKSSVEDGTLYARLNEKIEDYSAYANEIELIKKIPSLPNGLNKNSQEATAYSLSFFIRMLFSCLVDSDFIDTETFMNEERPRGNHDSIDALNNKFQNFLSSLAQKQQSELNQKRSQILARCIEFSEKDQGLYSLTVPTGGGKTFSSLAFALKHAQKHKLDRIIYVIPYTSIIEQTATIFKKELGQDCVLEHHSNFVLEDERLKLATENWDIPIVVTTNVQFFESLYANRTSKCRKLHNIAKSVVVFDEAQMIPVTYLKSCLQAVAELVENYNVTAVLCTATQPPFEQLLNGRIMMQEMMDDKEQLYLDFKKVAIRKRGEMDNTALLNELNAQKQCLCIVNTKKHAKEVFDMLQGAKFHLSASMCPGHRKEILQQIKKLLQGGEECKVVATQLIECGVDVDFPIVYRSLAGLDSIIQSAGRCNREGRLAVGVVNVFEPMDKSGKGRGYLEQCAKISKEIFDNFEDVLSLEAIKKYFELLYFIEGKDGLDKKRILDCFRVPIDFEFQKAADNFNLIESNTETVVVPFNAEAISLIRTAEYSKFPWHVLRLLQTYTVSVYTWQFNALKDAGCLEMINGAFFILRDVERNYDKDTGIIIPEAARGEAIFI